MTRNAVELLSFRSVLESIMHAQSGIYVLTELLEFHFGLKISRVRKVQFVVGLHACGSIRE
jgi:hypothetical protein